MRPGQGACRGLLVSSVGQGTSAMTADPTEPINTCFNAPLPLLPRTSRSELAAERTKAAAGLCCPSKTVRISRPGCVLPTSPEASARILR